MATTVCKMEAATAVARSTTAPRAAARAAPRATTSSVAKASAFVKGAPVVSARKAASRQSCSARRASVVVAAAPSPFKKPDCRLVMEDGSEFLGFSFGASTTQLAEVVFNTSLTGYQEILTDPSYKGQVVTFTHPHIGNTGINFGKLQPPSLLIQR